MQSKSVPDGDARDRAILRVIWLEGAANLVVLGLKLAVGVATGSLAILSDAVHSLTDVVNNGVAWVVVRWSARPPDEGHPYGHRKFETVAVFLLATLLVVTAFELARSALVRSEPLVVQSTWGLVGMLCVLSVNVVVATWENAWARRLASDILTADARHTFADVMVTIVAIAGWQAGARGFAWVDTAASLGVAALIGYFAYGLFRRALPVLVDHAWIEPERLRRTALEVPGVRDVRRVRSRAAGRRAEVDLVVSVAPEMSTLDSHEIANRVEEALRRELPVEALTVHVEPAEE